MNLILKTKGRQPISEKDKQWAEAKFKKLSRLVPPESVVEITLEDLYGPKGGVDKRVHVLAELPHAKEPFHLEETGHTFRRTISIAYDRFQRYIKKYRTRFVENHRYPRKFWIADVFARLTNRNQPVSQEISQNETEPDDR